MRGSEDGAVRHGKGLLQGEDLLFLLWKLDSGIQWFSDVWEIGFGEKKGMDGVEGI